MEGFGSAFFSSVRSHIRYIDTSYQIGSALGLAIMVGLASGQTESLQSIGRGQVDALNGGFHLAFIGAAVISAAAVVLSVVSIRRSPPPS